MPATYASLSRVACPRTFACTFNGSAPHELRSRRSTKPIAQTGGPRDRISLAIKIWSNLPPPPPCSCVLQRVPLSCDAGNCTQYAPDEGGPQASLPKSTAALCVRHSQHLNNHANPIDGKPIRSRVTCQGEPARLAGQIRSFSLGMPGKH